ncbi:glycosyltransferase [Paenibacillus sediminis]|uniref:Glycosyltransferase involved in cell wall biosynthesis n=1 Tax=Paenibacillus sediminis TaxID=664909 RepID=A0ABS4H5U1_9BACL|nr:glycosyltransferase [Paenibacillus sediminis]MBP1937876.1 glycosyltransferase involved in cell wall biosynthesis [Paenibacillus sediminis]
MLNKKRKMMDKLSRSKLSKKETKNPKKDLLRLSINRDSTEQLRILMVIDQFNVGGTETHVLSTARELLKRRAKVVVAAKRGKLLEPFLGLGCSVYEIDFVLDNYEPNWDQYIDHVNKLIHIIQSEKINIVHGHQTPSGRIAKVAAEQMDIPFVFTVHGMYYEDQFLNMLKNISSVISVSPAVQRMLLLNGIESTVIPNGIDLMAYDAYPSFFQNDIRASLGISDQSFVVTYAARLAWEKADICKDVIKACSELAMSSDLRLLIVGGGIHRNKVEADIDRIQRYVKKPFVHFIGEVVNMRSFYSISNCVIGTGRVGMEALACRRPLISVGSKGFIGLVKPEHFDRTWDSWFGDHGEAEISSQETIMKDLKLVMSLSSDQTNNYVWNGRRYVEMKFNIVNTTTKLIDVYKPILEKNDMLDRFNTY